MNKNNGLIAILLVIIIILGTYILVKQKNGLDFLFGTSSKETQTVTPSPDPVVSSEPTVPLGSKLYSDTNFGYSFLYSDTATVSIDATDKVLITPLSKTSPTTIQRVVGFADNSNGKWGKYVLSYGDKGWVVQKQNEKDGTLYSELVTPLTTTASGLPVFSGGTMSHGFGKYDYIVALNNTRFLIITGDDGTGAAPYNPQTDPTLILAKTVKAL